MNTKKIWVLSIMFGIVMSVLFYLVTANNGNNRDVNQEDEQASPPLEQVSKETAENHPETMNKLQIEQGKRAISIEVTEVQSVSGFIRPGSNVDVIAILPLPINEHTASQIHLSNIKVLAVGKTFADTADTSKELLPYQMVTLEVTPAEGASLTMAKELGVITLMLRGEEDQKQTENVKIRYEDLIKQNLNK